MDKKRNLKPISSRTERESKEKTASRLAKGSCDESASSSHTQFFKKPRHEELHKRVTVDQYLSISETISSSDTFRCVHGAAGKNYTDKGLLKRNFIKELDPIPVDKTWTSECAVTYGWEIVDKIMFLINDPTVGKQKERLLNILNEFDTIAKNGYRVDVLDSVCILIDFLIETLPKNPDRIEITTKLLENMKKPLILNATSDVITCFDSIRNYIGFLGYLLIRLEDDAMFDIVSEAILWHLSAANSERPPHSAKLHHTLATAAPVLYQTTARMLSVCTSHRFPTFINLALLLVCDSVENCIELMKENIIENIFYRFNPYFPDRPLPVYDINPVNPQDINLKLGDSSLNMSTTLSLLLILVKTTKQCLKENPEYAFTLPCPDSYSQRCFIWAYRYECRARGHRHQRTTLTVIAHALVYCFKSRLDIFSTILMQDVLSLSVLTEFPANNDWSRSVGFNTSQQDVLFKKILIYFSVYLLKLYPINQFMVEHKYWLLGLTYLIDPGLCYLRAHWAPSLYAEIRKVSLQALVFTVPIIKPELLKKYGLIRRIMWYIEWYSENPYELQMLYWCMRLLQVTLHHRKDPNRSKSVQDLFETHGVIIVIHLCYTLLGQKIPPVEKSQAILSLCLRLLTSTVEQKARITCCVYPTIKWPTAINTLAKKMLDTVLYSLEKNYIVSDRWLIALLNFIWEGVIWKPEYREIFIKSDGIYKLLDIITLVRAPAQCIALALVCDVARAGDAVGQLVSWRAKYSASTANPCTVKRGSTIVSLLASIFRDECISTGVILDHNGIIQDMESPIMSASVRQSLTTQEFLVVKNKRTPICYAAGDVAGSRLSKVFAMLHMLSEDLEFKVALADEAYSLYKNIIIAPEDESILVLCSNYLSLKLNEVWIETKLQSPGLLPHDESVLEEFLHINKGWSHEIRNQQNRIIERARQKEHEEEYNLYEFLARVRLNIALDGLREVRCEARSADRARVTHALIQDAVRAHHRRSVSAKKMGAPILRTYGPSLDDRNLTGQNVKVYSIHPKNKPKVRENIPSS